MNAVDRVEAVILKALEDCPTNYIVTLQDLNDVARHVARHPAMVDYLADRSAREHRLRAR